jgi:predicted component of type VI protein secretion system
MKTSETAAALSAKLAKSLHTQLCGLSEKHTKKLDKAVGKATDKLAKLFAKYTEKELVATEKKVQKTAARVVAKRVPKKAVRKLRKAILKPAALLTIAPIVAARPVVVSRSKRRVIAA